MDITRNIASIREGKGLKQSEIASKMGIDQPNYSRLEKRGDKLSVEQVNAIATALGVTLNELLGLDAPLENEGKVKELEKRIEELESRVKDKNLALQHFVMSDEILSLSIVSDMVIDFKRDNEVNPLYVVTDEFPFCCPKKWNEIKREVNFYLYSQSRKSNVLKNVIDRFREQTIWELLHSYNIIYNESENIYSGLKERILKDEGEYYENREI
jgi:transcriptional regulator with XRE-family HTH domain